jgi:CrcB protein
MKTISTELVIYLLAGAIFGVVFRSICFSFFGNEFYLGNLLVYLSGSFFIGYMFNLTREVVSDEVKLCVIAGILGGLTTFSGFVIDFMKFTQVGEFKGAFVYFMITNLIAISGCFLGYQISIDND